jgi:CMP-N-acetylneuraminic acid synthetase
MTFKAKQVLALIPARGGSKGVPGKNLRMVRGKALIAHTLEAASKCPLVDKVYLSSDDEKILEAGRAFGVETLKRDPAAATDSATAKDVVNDFIGRLPPELVRANPYIVYLQPTSPMRNAGHIARAFHEIDAKNGDTGLSVVALKKTPFKSFKLDREGFLESLFEERLSNANRQTLPDAYYPNGAIYIFPLSEFIKNGGFPSNGSVPFIMSEKESIDIDSEEDIEALERL